MWEEPTQIRLPDGRIFLIKDLVGKRTRSTNYNLRTERRIKTAERVIKDNKIPRSLYQAWATKMPKYQLAERVWQAQATTEELEAKYGITTEQAKHLRYQARYIVERLDLLR